MVPQKRILAPYGLKIMQIVRNAFLLHFRALISIITLNSAKNSTFWHHMALNYVLAPYGTYGAKTISL